MKKTFHSCVLLALVLLISSCYFKKHSIVDDNTRFYSHTWDEILNRGNVKLFDTDFSPNVIYDNVTTHLEGIDDVKKYFAEYITAFSNRSFKILEIYGQGNRVIKRWSFTGTHTGSFAGIKATGKKVTVEGITIAVMSQDKIIAERDYTDDLGLMQQLGVVPKF
ncbi:MAG: ester cyclase [Ferruginibacter sp.]